MGHVAWARVLEEDWDEMDRGLGCREGGRGESGERCRSSTRPMMAGKWQRRLSILGMGGENRRAETRETGRWRVRRPVESEEACGGVGRRGCWPAGRCDKVGGGER
jgi:hypothetical protein